MVGGGAWGWPEECLLYPGTPDKVTDPACALFLEEEQFPFCEWPERARKGGPTGKGEGRRGSLQKKAAGIHLLGIGQEGGPGSRNSAGLCYAALQTCFLVCDHTLTVSTAVTEDVPAEMDTLTERRPASRSPKLRAVGMKIKPPLGQEGSLVSVCVCACVLACMSVCVYECMHTCSCGGPQC